MLDSTRLRAELFFIHRSLSEVAATRSSGLLDELRAHVGGTTTALLWQSLFADCLRVVFCAARVDAVISEETLEGVREFVASASRHYAYGRHTSTNPAAVRAFLGHYAIDAGPFGHHAAVRWCGHALCIRGAALGHNEPLERYARLMWWLTGEACRVSGSSLHDPRWQERLPEIAELRRMLTTSGHGPQPEVERRTKVFLSNTRVFAPVQHSASIFEVDPLDVEQLHSEARASFRALVEQATVEAHHTTSGRTLLIEGASGSGKTHLLRSFWSYVQEHGRGFVAYAPMDSSADDYARYLVDRVVQSLAQPYSGVRGEETGLHELASGLAQLKGDRFAAKVARLSEMLSEPQHKLDDYVHQLSEELLGHPELKDFDPDLLRVLFYALCPDPTRLPRVYKYLRCEALHDRDRSALGNVAPRAANDAKAMIRSLARLAFITRRATFVLMVDQAELSGLDASRAVVVFQRALDALLGIVSEVRSIIVVIACLSGLYEKVKTMVAGSAIDRLEQDPPPARLLTNRSYEEITALVGIRLAWLFAEAGAVYRASEPVYPIPENQLRNLVNRRPRDIVDWCQTFRQRCITAGKIVADDTPPLPPVPPVKPTRPPLDQIAEQWHEACRTADLARDLSDGELLALVGEAAKAYAIETSAEATVITKHEVMQLQLAAGLRITELTIAVTNGAPQGGIFGGQITRLRKAARIRTPVALRTAEFPTGARSAEVVTNLLDGGGRAVHLDRTALRVLLATQHFAPAFASEQIAAWRRRDRPIGSALARVFEHEADGLGEPSAPKIVVEIPEIGRVPPPASKRAGARVRAAE